MGQANDEILASLLKRAADDHKVPSALVADLLLLESAFPDFTIHGAKTEFSKRIAALLDAAADEARQ